jgi:hypothetical protein
MATPFTGSSSGQLATPNFLNLEICHIPFSSSNGHDGVNFRLEGILGMTLTLRDRRFPIVAAFHDFLTVTADDFLMIWNAKLSQPLLIRRYSTMMIP